ncbi:hypothetical protein [Oceanobacillus sp. FSL W7-1309]|uniref:hypothetical protein n=1 Tax=Oceanobacillus sp. FSL W7-1309 TaxID=2954539 RepID=UPI0011813BD8
MSLTTMTEFLLTFMTICLKITNVVIFWITIIMVLFLLVEPVLLTPIFVLPFTWIFLVEVIVLTPIFVLLFTWIVTIHNLSLLSLSIYALKKKGIRQI